MFIDCKNVIYNVRYVLFYIRYLQNIILKCKIKYNIRKKTSYNIIYIYIYIILFL